MKGPDLTPRQKLKKKRRRAVYAALTYLTNHVVSRIFFSAPRRLWYRHVMGFELGTGTSVLTDFRVSRPGNLRIGNHTVINNHCRFDNRYCIAIGNNVSITYGTMILTKGHDIDSPDFGPKGDGVVIGDHAWICANVLILPGVRIGRGAVVLSGSVVTKDVPDLAVVGGNPAQFIRARPDNFQYCLKWDPWVPFFG